MASIAQKEVKVSVVTRSGAGEQHQSSTEIEVTQDEDIEVKEEPLTNQQPIPIYITGRSIRTELEQLHRRTKSSSY